MSDYGITNVVQLCHFLALAGTETHGVLAPYKLDSFHVVDKNGSTVQSSYNEKAAARAAFIMGEPDWTNVESFYE